VTSETLYVKVLAYQDEFGGYRTYVFRILDTQEYFMSTLLPNWDIPAININDIGYLSYIFVQAGEDTWFNRTTKKREPYQYDGVYIHKFIKEQTYKDIIL